MGDELSFFASAEPKKCYQPSEKVLEKSELVPFVTELSNNHKPQRLNDKLKNK